LLTRPRLEQIPHGIFELHNSKFHVTLSVKGVYNEMIILIRLLVTGHRARPHAHRFYLDETERVSHILLLYAGSAAVKLPKLD